MSSQCATKNENKCNIYREPSFTHSKVKCYMFTRFIKIPSYGNFCPYEEEGANTGKLSC